MDKLLTPTEVAAELRLEVGTVYRLFRREALPYIDLGHKTKRVRRSALDAYIKEREAGECS